MKVELIFCLLDKVRDELTLNDLVDLTKDVEIDYVEEKAEFIIRVVSGCEELIQTVKNRLSDARSSNCLVISDQLIDNKNKHDPFPSSTARVIIKEIRNSTSVCGLIALTKTLTSHVQGIDANALSGRKKRQELRRYIEQITHRLWYKNPPKNLFQHSKGHLFEFDIRPVTDQYALQKSFELRGRIYTALGYIESSNRQAPIEMDAYDLTAIHFLVLDHANGDRIAGTMRLIIPGLNPLISVNNQYNLNNFEEWTLNIAKNCADRQWWKTVGRGSPSALPVLEAFTYFNITELEFNVNTSLMPRNVCELSRLIVAPEYRGMGISNLLINHAIKVAKELKRQNIWLECAPHHIDMYKKHGFIVKDHQGQYFYERAQRLDTWAVAMYLGVDTCQNSSDGASTVCYRLPITDLRSGNCSLLFRFAQRSAADVENAFNRPINTGKVSEEGKLRGVSASLKNLIPATLSCLEINNFIICLKVLMKQLKVDKLSLQHSNGRSFSFNPEDINSAQRDAIESKILHWLR